MMDARISFEDIVRAVAALNVPANQEQKKADILVKAKNGVKGLTQVLDLQTVFLTSGAGVALEFSDADSGFGYSAEQQKKLCEIKKKKEDERKEAEKSARDGYKAPPRKPNNISFTPYPLQRSAFKYAAQGNTIH